MQRLQENPSGGWDYQVAMAHAYRGETDAAIAALEAAYEKHDAGTIAILNDPFMDNIRQEPRFRAVLEKLKFNP